MNCDEKVKDQKLIANYVIKVCIKSIITVFKQHLFCYLVKINSEVQN